MKKRRVMLDGMVSGTALEGTIEIKGTEVDRMRKLLIANGAEVRDGGLSKTVTNNTSSMVVALRTHRENKNMFFLNISGNPLTFVRGNNIYGYGEADRVIVTACRMALELLRGTVPRRIYEAIQKREIFIYSLEFATYTMPIKDKKKLLNDWAHVYRHAYSTVEGKEHESLLDMLDLQFYRKHKKHKSSICLRIMSKDGAEEEAMFMAYDKAKEMKDVAARDRTRVNVPRDVENRIRLDLNLSKGWFRSHQVKNQKIKTLAHLTEYVEHRYGTWIKFLEHEFQWAIDRTCLFHMWKFSAEDVLARKMPANKNKRLTQEAYDAMLKARSLMMITNDEWNGLIKTKKMKTGKIELNPHPEDLVLDMSVV